MEVGGGGGSGTRRVLGGHTWADGDKLFGLESKFNILLHAMWHIYF